MLGSSLPWSIQMGGDVPKSALRRTDAIRKPLLVGMHLIILNSTGQCGVMKLFLISTYQERSNQMTREQRKEFIEAIGMVTIVASLIFLGLEMRTNTTSVRATAYQTWVSVNAQLNTVDESLSAAIAKGTLDSANLDEESYIRFALWHYTFVQMAQATNYMYKMGTVDFDLWESEINRTAGHLALPGVRQWWDAGARTQFPPDFVELLESTSSKITRWHWEPERGYIREDQRTPADKIE